MFPNNFKGLSKAWRAALTAEDEEDSNGDKLTLPAICQEIDDWINSDLSSAKTKMSLSNSATLINGAAKMCNDGMTQLLKDLQKLETKMIRRRRVPEQDDSSSDSSNLTMSTAVTSEDSSFDFLTYITSPTTRKKRATFFFIQVQGDSSSNNSKQSSEETSETDSSTTTNKDSVKEKQGSKENETSCKKDTITSDGESDETFQTNLCSPTNSRERTATKRTTGETSKKEASSSISKRRKINEEAEEFENSIGLNTLFKEVINIAGTPVTDKTKFKEPAQESPKTPGNITLKSTSTPLRKTAIQNIVRPSQRPIDFNVLYSENSGTPVTDKSSDQNTAKSAEKSSDQNTAESAEKSSSSKSSSGSVSKKRITSTAEKLKESNSLTDVNVLFSEIPDVPVERFEDPENVMDVNLLFAENLDSVAIDSDIESRNSIILPCSATQKKKDGEGTRNGNVEITVTNKDIWPTKPEVKNQETQTHYIQPEIIYDLVRNTDPDIEVGFIHVYNGQCTIPAYYGCGVINQTFKE